VKVALAYSGGLDTSVAARWLREERGLDVVAVAVDVGQELDRDSLHARAAAAGAELFVVDALDEFVTGYCWPALQANALYEGKYPLVSALARPLIAARVAEVARNAGAEAVAHGCTGKGNDQVRFETTFAAVAPGLRVIAPVREAALSRDEARARAAAWSIPITDEAKVYSVDENLWGRTVECGPLEDPWDEPPADAFALTADPLHAPEQPDEIVLAFEHGLPVALDGRSLDPAELIQRLTAIGGRHGFGRVDMIENRLVGIKSRELYEVPGALALIQAHRDLEDLTLERDLAHEKAGVERRWAELAYYGQWHGPLHASLRDFVASTQASVTGEVRLRFHKGSCRVVGRRSPNGLYDHSLATYGAAEDRFDHRQAEGFVKLWSLPIRTWAARRQSPAAAGDGRVKVEPSARSDVETSVGRVAALRGGEDPAPQTAEPLWGGRFEAAPSEQTMAFTRSLQFDVRLAPYDIEATQAHARGLARAGLLSNEEADQIHDELDRVGVEITDGTFEWNAADEDIHSAIERALIERLGSTGAKVHAGRSRNDLVVTDLRLWAKAAAGALGDKVAALAEALAHQAAANHDAVMPGYTHLQRAQPVLLAHHLLAHAFPFLRDAQRLLSARDAADVSGLGAGALAGSTLPVDPAGLAETLGFATTFDNSIDAVSDRDFVLQLLAACTITSVHLSRLAEDIVLWSSAEFGFARPSEGDATGSSMMPQKRNPDVAELARGKAGRVLGDLVAVATAMKGLPLAYDRDLQEDKEAVFDAVDTVAGALAAMTEVIHGLTFDAGRMREAAGGSLFATDLAEHLVAKGMPFREAHELIGRVSGALERSGRAFEDVTPDEWMTWSPLLDDAPRLLSAERSVAARETAGGTSPQSVKRQIETVGERVGAVRARIAEGGVHATVTQI
jgi:argininosuccinate lyase/argininosuccinate synthase